jgi:hypothetical protein
MDEQTFTNQEDDGKTISDMEKAKERPHWKR